jgi:hypothetical protein
LPWSASTTGVASKPERADPSASEAASEPGSDALKCVPPLREKKGGFQNSANPALRVHKVIGGASDLIGICHLNKTLSLNLSDYSVKL